MPKAGMNETELIWMTIISAASVVVPSPPMSTLMKKLKARKSKNQFIPTGSPKRSVRANSCQARRTQKNSECRAGRQGARQRGTLDAQSRCAEIAVDEH